MKAYDGLVAARYRLGARMRRNRFCWERWPRIPTLAPAVRLRLARHYRLIGRPWQSRESLAGIYPITREDSELAEHEVAAAKIRRRVLVVRDSTEPTAPYRAGGV